MAGRTLLQQALPVSLGLKAAGWLAAIMDARAGLGRVLEERLALQLGGAAGTLASLGDAGPALTGALAARLGLAEPLLPWHTARARIVELGAALGIVAGTADKIGFDVALLMQSEVGEAFEPAAPGRGGSSTLPHKRNPVHAVSANAAARQAVGLVSVLFQAMHQEHERAAGGWQSEWQPLRDLLRLAGGAAALVADSLAGLEVDAAAMAANLGRTGGVLLAERVMLRLAPLLGRTEAHGVVERASKVALADKSAFADTLLAEDGVAAHLGRAELDALLDPNTYLGASDTYIDRVLAAYARTAADAAAPQG